MKQYNILVPLILLFIFMAIIPNNWLGSLGLCKGRNANRKINVAATIKMKSREMCGYSFAENTREQLNVVMYPKLQWISCQSILLLIFFSIVLTASLLILTSFTVNAHYLLLLDFVHSLHFLHMEIHLQISRSYQSRPSCWVTLKNSLKHPCLIHSNHLPQPLKEFIFSYPQSGHGVYRDNTLKLNLHNYS